MKAKKVLAICLGLSMVMSMSSTGIYAMDFGSGEETEITESETFGDGVEEDYEEETENTSAEDQADESLTADSSEETEEALLADGEQAEYVYVIQEIPYSQFYAFLNNTASVDIVSSATTQKSASCSNVYFGETPTIEGGTDILGVKVPVKMTVDAAKQIENAQTVEAPAVYLESTQAGGYQLNADAKVTTTESVAAAITSNSIWGDYVLELTDSTLGKDPAAVYGAYLTTTDGTQYALRQAENMWNPHNYFEFAWSTGHTEKEPHGGILHGSYFASMEGKTIASVTYITTEGISVYNLAEGLYVAPNANVSIQAQMNDLYTLQIEGLPADLVNPKVSVATSGRGATYLCQDVSLEGNTVTLAQAPVNGTTYNVVVSSDNYAAIKGTLTTNMQFVLMNIPYSKFYEGEGTSAVDVVSSATKSKPLVSGLAGGSYHENEDGSDITGITYPVLVMDASVLADYTQIADDREVTITVSNRGQTSTTTYVGKDSLFQAPSYSYYPLSETPAYYKVLKDGVFSETNPEAIASASVKAAITSDTTYGDYQISFTGSFPFDTESTTVYGVLLGTTDGSVYGLRHVQNIWRGTNLAWSTGHTTTSHGSALSYENYQSMEGKTINSITYYTSAGTYELVLKNQLYVAPYYQTISAYAMDLNTLAIAGLPADIKNPKAAVTYTVTGEDGRTSVKTLEADMAVENGTAVLTSASLESGVEYTVKVTSDNYAKATAVLSAIKDAPVLNKVSNVVKGVKVFWSAVEGASNYAVYYKAEGDAEWTKAGSTSSTSKVVNGLTTGTKYTFKVCCASADGKVAISSMSEEKTITFYAAPVIRSLTASSSSVKVSWTNTKAPAYKVFYRKLGTTKWYKAGTTKNTSFTIKGLKAGSTYVVTVRGITANGKQYVTTYYQNGNGFRVTQ